MLSRCTFLIALASLLFSLAPALSAEKNSNELQLTTERVIIFKDGYSLIIKRGVATTDKAGEAFTDDVPDAAVIGSFWAVPEEGRLISMLAGWKSTKDTDDKQMPCTQPIEILLANKGKQARVELHDKTFYPGAIQEVLVDRTEVPLTPAQLELLDLSPLSATAKPKPGLMSSRVSRLAAEIPPSEHTLTAIGGSNFILRTDEGDMLLPIASVRSIVVKDMKTTIGKTLTTSKKTKRLSFKFEAAEKKQAVTIMYFRRASAGFPPIEFR
jgi:hypothetical protein